MAYEISEARKDAMVNQMWCECASALPEADEQRESRLLRGVVFAVPAGLLLWAGLLKAAVAILHHT